MAKQERPRQERPAISSPEQLKAFMEEYIRAKEEKERRSSVHAFIDDSFVQDTVFALLEELTGNRPVAKVTGEPGKFSTAVGQMIPPDTISMDQGLIDAVRSGQLSVAAPNPLDAARSTMAHEGGHFFREQTGTSSPYASRRESDAHMFSALLRSFSDLASASPEQVDLGNVKNRAFTYFLGSMMKDPRIKHTVNPETAFEAWNYSPEVNELLMTMAESLFFSDHPSRNER